MTAMRGDSNEAVRRLLALRVTDDLTADEAALVDQEARYSEKIRAELDAYANSVKLLRDAGGEKLAVESRPSLWSRIEPRLGPAGRQRRRRIERFLPTWQLAAACLALFGLTLVIEFQPEVKRVEWVNPNPNRVVDFQPNAPRVVQQAAIRPLFGVVVRELTPEVRRQLLIDNTPGVVIISVMQGSSADLANLRRGDVIVSVDGKEVRAPVDLVRLLGNRRSGEDVQVELIRGGIRVLETVRLSTPQARTQPGMNPKVRNREFHREAFELTDPHLAEAPGLPGAVRV